MIITEIAHSVYDDFHGLIIAKDLKMKQAQKPVLGMCFGHQLKADIL